MSIIISSDGEKAERIDKSDFEKEDRLQQYIHENPESIPLYKIREDIKLLILAREFRTTSGPIDALGIDKTGEIYIIETKLFKNADKRTVISQALDYGAALWRHSPDFQDFQSVLDEHTQRTFKLSAAEKIKNFFNLSEEDVNIIFEKMRENIHEGIFHIVILMDSIDERLKDLIVYVNQNSKFDIYAVELEYYKYKNQEIIIPRLFGAEVKKDINNEGLGNWKKDREPWWSPILTMKFDDPDQEQPAWRPPNNIILKTPLNGALIRAYASKANDECGIYLSISNGTLKNKIGEDIKRDWEDIKRELPANIDLQFKDEYLYFRGNGLIGDAQKYDWLKKNLNIYVNTLRLRLKKWK